LFGVDINPNSVKICRLRLWIELLKNTYYKTDGELETLPNIDINIKCGNSLISRFALDADLKKALKKHKISITNYRESVANYRSAKNKTDKWAMLELINKIKTDFKTSISQNSKEQRELDKVSEKLYFKYNANSLFEAALTDAQEKDKADLTDEIQQLKTTIDEIENNIIYQNAFEWRFEFPEVLNDEGDFVGFDVVIGNPPYFSISKNKDLTNYLNNKLYKTYSKSTDIYCIFFERGGQLLRHRGILNYITSNSWLRAIYGELLKSYFKDDIQIFALLNIEDVQIFEEATVETSITFLEKEKTNQPFSVCGLQGDYEIGESINDYFDKKKFNFKIPDSNTWIISNPTEFNLKNKIDLIGKELSDFEISINFGIKTGYNAAFIVEKSIREDLIKKDINNQEIFKPILRGRDLKKYTCDFSDYWLINSHNGLKKKDIKPVNVQKNYPIVYEYLSSFQPKVEKRYDKGIHWSNLRNCAYLLDFEKPKIIWGEISDKPKFAYDENKFYAEATTFFMTGEKLKYLLAILNSKVSEWYFSKIGTTTGMGTIRWKKYKILQLPIPVANFQKQQQIESKVTEVLAQKQADPKADTSELETAIDALVYELYDLTAAEIALIEKG
jgi:galactitol-specific phosphotransferase system IIB component